MGCCSSRPKPEFSGRGVTGSLAGFPVVEEFEARVTLASKEERELLEEPGLLFAVEFRLNAWRWRVYRTVSDFFTLQLHIGTSGLSFWRLWKLNIESEALVSPEDLTQLQTFLELAMAEPEKRESVSFQQFAEISVFSFEESKSVKEGWVSKRRGGRKFVAGTLTSVVKRALHSLRKYTRRWFVLRDDHLFYSTSPKSSDVLDVLLLDANTTVAEIRPERDKDVASRCVWWISGYKCALKIKNAYRTLVLKFPNRQRMLQWKIALETATRSAKSSQATRGQARGHSDCTVQTLIDGAEYFSHVAAALERATADVFIVGWWLTPDLLLVRGQEGGEHRLRDYLQRAGERGVKIYIVLYSEPSLKLYNDSEFVKTTLEALHSNVHVLSHPARTGANATLFWSHHQKLVVVDHSLVFLGGIDLCLGRFDRPSHRLQCSGEFRGRDFVNFCIRDFSAGVEVRENVHENEAFIERNVLPRLPWHDVAVEISSTSLATDVARHFVALWNHVKTDKHKGTVSVRFLKVKTSRVKELRNKIKDIFQKKKNAKSGKSSRSVADTDLETDEDADLQQLQQQQAVGDFPLPVTVPIKSSSSRLEVLSKELSQQPEDDAVAVPLPHRPSMTGPRQHSAAETSESSATRVKFLRSLSWWSFGLPKEQGILNAYLSLIKEARNFIYIENQFFIAGVEAARAPDAHRLFKNVKNRVGEALIQRLLLAEANQENFRLYIVLPLLPAFQAEPLFSKEAYPMRATLLLIAETLRALRQALGVEVFARRVTAHGLRTHELWTHEAGEDEGEGQGRGRQWQTEQIYVHSKLMIVDDCRMIVGSANINDRSLSGNRDSEIAVLVEDVHTVSEARRRLWTEHLGSHYEETDHPESAECLQRWQRLSGKNTEIYDEVFKCWPANVFSEKEQISARVTSAPDNDHTRSRLDEIRGRLVDYPIDFLRHVDLTQPEPVFAKLLPREVAL